MLENMYAIAFYVSTQCLPLLGSQVLANIIFSIMDWNDYP